MAYGDSWGFFRKFWKTTGQLYEGYYNKSREQFYYRIVRTSFYEWQDSSKK